jgi:hypothetical protein
MSQAKPSRVIIPFEDIDFSRLKIEECKENEYSKYQLLSLPKYEHADGQLTALYLKTPLLDFNIGGFPPAKDKEGNELFKDDSERAKWRCYLGDAPEEQKILKKVQEFQEKLIKDKASIVGKKDEKKFELENLIGETTNKEGDTLSYIRFNFRTDIPTNSMSTKFFIRKDGVDEEITIKTPKDFEDKFRRGQFRYRMIVSLSKVWRQKKLPGKYGATFKIEQMQIEMREDASTMINKNMFAKSQFDDDEVTTKVSEIDLNIEPEGGDEDAPEEAPEDDEEEEEEIKPAKKATSTAVKVTATKAVSRKKATTSA